MDEAIDRANELPYGLVAYAFINSAERPSDGVEVNNLSIDHRGKATAEHSSCQRAHEKKLN